MRAAGAGASGVAAGGCAIRRPVTGAANPVLAATLEGDDGRKLFRRLTAGLSNRAAAARVRT